jgi:hypothetical protein
MFDWNNSPTYSPKSMNFSSGYIYIINYIILSFTNRIILLFYSNDYLIYDVSNLLLDEFYHLISKHPEEWLNFIERISNEFGEDASYLEEKILADEKLLKPEV